MGELYFVSEDPTTKTSSYASRISQQEWQKHKAEIKRLHESGATRREIITAMSVHGFRPSFGQLVAQMTRWRLMRYSKLEQHARQEPSCVATSKAAAGILQVVAALVGQSESATANDTASVNTIDSMSELLHHLSLGQQQLAAAERAPEDILTLPDHSDRRNDLAFADFCLLGGSYDEAYRTYLKIALSMIEVPAQARDEIKLVQAILGCLRSASTNTEWQQACTFAKQYTTPTNDLSKPLQSIGIASRDAEQHCPRTYTELARITLKVLNHLDRTFSPLTAANPVLVNSVISRNWLALRLNRLPTWHDVLADATHTPPPEIENLAQALQWAQRAITQFGLLFDEQISKLWQTARTSLETWSYLLFWRLSFTSRQIDQPACPVLQIHLTDAASCVLSSQETVATLAHLITIHLDGIPAPIQAHQTILHALQQVRDQCDDRRIMPKLWAVLHDTLHPALLSNESRPI